MSSGDKAVVWIVALSLAYCSAKTVLNAHSSVECTKSGGSWVDDACRRKP
jgi:hypothetical protein